MKSDRSKPVTLVVRHENTLTDKIENFIHISDGDLLDGNQHVMRFKTGKAGATSYPVMFDKAVKKGDIVLPNELRKELGFSLNGKVECGLDVVRDDEWLDIDKIIFTIEKTLDGVIKDREVDAGELMDAIRFSVLCAGSDYPLQVGQKFIIPFRSVRLKLRVDYLSEKLRGAEKQPNRFYRMTDLSEIELQNEQSHYFKLIGRSTPDFVSRGIGGHKKEIAYIVRNLFYTRAVKQELLDAYGVKKHAKGMLLYGPPGTGKTLIAKCISELFTKEQVVIIEGPQLKNMYYGATQQNLADLFINARRYPNKLFVFIFDEIDALFSTRGSDTGTSTQTNNDLVSRILTILDGPDSPKNIVIIGTTNRKELIDPALLRAGRLDVHVYIGLPDEIGRLEILQVHTKDMLKTLHKNVDLSEIARLSKNFSGAELARLVSLAQILAMGGNYVARDNKLVLRDDIKSIDQAEKVTQQHFLRALREIKPAFGIDDDLAFSCNQRFAIYDIKIKAMIDRYMSSIVTLQNSKGMRQSNLLICGEDGTGKSSLAAHLALQSKFPHLQILTPNKLLPHSISKQLDIIDEMFAKARQSTEPSVIIIDGIENIIESTPDHLQYNNKLRLKLIDMLKEAKGSDNKVLVIAVAENHEFMQRLGLSNQFAEVDELTNVHLDCANSKECLAIITNIAVTLDIKVANDASLRDPGLVVDIVLKDLIYELRKYCSRDGVLTLKLSEFLQQIPKRYTHTKESLVAILDDERKPALSLFRK
jgi:SpoVK/Ycf46/Vps4 family AAA+-type ATPase